MNEMGLYIFHLKNLLVFFFDLSIFYDQAQFTLVDKTIKIERSELYLKAKEHLDLVLNEKNEKFEELFFVRQSLKKARKKVKK